MADFASALSRELQPAVTAAVIDAAARPEVPIAATPAKGVSIAGAAASAAKTISDQAVLRVMASPAVQFATNNEPWWQSWVTVGSIAPILAGLFGEVALINAGNWDATAHATCIVPVIGGLTALYGRWIARKPIGV